jgi:hypothetical protein
MKVNDSVHRWLTAAVTWMIKIKAQRHVKLPSPTQLLLIVRATIMQLSRVVRGCVPRHPRKRLRRHASADIGVKPNQVSDGAVIGGDFESVAHRRGPKTERGNSPVNLYNWNECRR